MIKNMTYYILIGDEDKTNVQFDSAQLGDTTNKMFYPARGFFKMINIINDEEELIPLIHIFDENEKTYTVEDFIKIISKLTMMQR